MINGKAVENELDINENEENYISYEQMLELGKKQWEVAMQGDTRMLIWLGKNYLNQSDSPMVVSEKPFDRIEFNECDIPDCHCKENCVEI